MKKSKHIPEICVAAAILLAVVLWGYFVPLRATAADGQGAADRLGVKVVSTLAYNVSKETALFVTLDGTDTLTGLDDPVVKFTAARIFRMSNPASSSVSTRQNLKVQLKFSVGAATANVWLAWYYVDPAVPATFHLVGLSQPLGGVMSATAAQDGALFLSLVEVEDTYGANHVVIFSDSVSAGTAQAWLGSY